MEWTVNTSAVERLDLKDHQWIEVRKQLSAGEERDISRKSAKRYQQSGPDEDKVTIEYDITRFSIIRAAAYVVAWSAPIVIPANFGLEKKIPIIESLHPDAFEAIDEAIGAYLAKRDSARSEEKKEPAIASGVTASEATALSAA